MKTLKRLHHTLSWLTYAAHDISNALIVLSKTQQFQTLFISSKESLTFSTQIDTAYMCMCYGFLFILRFYAVTTMSSKMVYTNNNFDCIATCTGHKGLK